MSRHDAPVIRFVRGCPTPSEIAAVVAALHAGSGPGPQRVVPVRVTSWASPARSMTTAPNRPASPQRPWPPNTRGT